MNLLACVIGACVVVALIPDDVWQAVAERIRNPGPDRVAQRLAALREPDRTLGWTATLPATECNVCDLGGGEHADDCPCGMWCDYDGCDRNGWACTASDDTPYCHKHFDEMNKRPLIVTQNPTLKHPEKVDPFTTRCTEPGCEWVGEFDNLDVSNIVHKMHEATAHGPLRGAT